MDSSHPKFSLSENWVILRIGKLGTYIQTTWENLLMQSLKYHTGVNVMNDGDCRKYILEILYEYNRENASTMMHIGQIRDEIQSRSGEEVDEDQVMNCGIYLFNERMITIQGNPKLRGWVEAIISHQGIRHLEYQNRQDQDEVT